MDNEEAVLKKLRREAEVRGFQSFENSGRLIVLPRFEGLSSLRRFFVDEEDLAVAAVRVGQNVSVALN
jgi:hypothetical protein